MRGDWRGNVRVRRSFAEMCESRRILLCVVVPALCSLSFSFTLSSAVFLSSLTLLSLLSLSLAILSLFFVVVVLLSVCTLCRFLFSDAPHTLLVLNFFQCRE